MKIMKYYIFLKIRNKGWEWSSVVEACTENAFRRTWI
jgi:hypothetical protein